MPVRHVDLLRPDGEGVRIGSIVRIAARHAPLRRSGADRGSLAGTSGCDDSPMTDLPLAEHDLAALVEEWLTWTEAAAALGVTEAKVRTMIRDHELAAAVPAPAPGRRCRPASSRTGCRSRGSPGC